MHRKRGRPIGEIRIALRQAAQEPGTVLQLAARAQVGRAAAYYTASRMLSSGELEVRVPSKPAVLGLAEPRQVEQAGAELEAVLMAWR